MSAPVEKFIHCIFCEAFVMFEGLPAMIYKEHFTTEHKIKSYNTDPLVLETLKRELPEEYAEIKNLVNAEAQTDTVILTSIAIQVGISEEDEEEGVDAEKFVDQERELHEDNDYDMEYMGGMSETDEYVDTAIFSDDETLSTTSERESVKVKKKRRK
eukprot:TRINITY_DN75918_c0_g1_i1.p1 TRINITY_DN75918_c0_g1~~TRINITY_DN75918_c0_g1_i1.p1  ORF type:complete len:173 (-),score=41.15 TRINITY_DN75918_c0_g1_i1:53-523(-)